SQRLRTASRRGSATTVFFMVSSRGTSRSTLLPCDAVCPRSRRRLQREDGRVTVALPPERDTATVSLKTVPKSRKRRAGGGCLLTYGKGQTRPACFQSVSFP